MKKILLYSLIGLFFTGCSNHEDNAKYEQCVQKGIAYYKEIWSYPRLTSQDISAEDKAAESCSRSLVAFDKF